MPRASRTLAYPLFHPASRQPTPITISLADFEDAFPRESQHIEFKRGVSHQEIQSTAVAFSNASGGVILIGIKDDGTVLGRALDEGTQDDIHQAMQAARDVGRYALAELDVEGRPVSVVSVDRRREGFAQTSGGVVRVRRGTRDEALFGSELVTFANERTSTRYERTALGVGADQISARARSGVRAAMGWRTASKDRLQQIGLLDGERLTVAGALYLLDDPTETLGKAFTEILRYPEEQSADYDLREEFRGPIPDVLRASVERLQTHLGSELVVLGSQRYELDRLPEVVLREAIANALAHRSYEANGTAVRIEIRPTMVVVRSPGGLPEPVTVANIREANAARNFDVIRLLRQFGLAEDAGRGIDVMQDTMAQQMLDPPRFLDSGHEVVVELPVRSAVTATERAWVQELERRGSLQGVDRIILVHAARGESLTNRRVRELVGVNSDRAREILHRLRDQSFLDQRGRTAGSSYRLSGSLRPPAGLRLSNEELTDVIIRLARQGPIANRDVREATGLDRVEALTLLDRLVQARRLRRTGERRGVQYHAT